MDDTRRIKHANVDVSRAAGRDCRNERSVRLKRSRREPVSGTYNLRDDAVGTASARTILIDIDINILDASLDGGGAKDDGEDGVH